MKVIHVVQVPGGYNVTIIYQDGEIYSHTFKTLSKAISEIGKRTIG